jgi:hypothetical protein
MAQRVFDACATRDIQGIINGMNDIDFSTYDDVSMSAIILTQSILQNCHFMKERGITDPIWDTYIDSAIEIVYRLVRG